jgi:hypothetical protein
VFPRDTERSVCDSKILLMRRRLRLQTSREPAKNETKKQNLKTCRNPLTSEPIEIHVTLLWWNLEARVNCLNSTHFLRPQILTRGDDWIWLKCYWVWTLHGWFCDHTAWYLSSIIYGLHNPFYCLVYKYPYKTIRIITYTSCCQVDFCTPIHLLRSKSTFALCKNPSNSS